jgi:hypothetical protein
MYYILQKFQFFSQIDYGYFQNPTKFLELPLSNDDRLLLKDYLTVSQQINYKLQTELSGGKLIPIKIYSNVKFPNEGYTAIGFKDIYDFLIYKNHYLKINNFNVKICKIFNWKIFDKRIVDSSKIIDTFDDVYNLWYQSFDIASDQSCQNMALL